MNPGLPRLVWGLALGLAAAGAAVPAAACSMASGYKVPTNFELAARADTIVVAEVVGEKPGENPWSGTVLTRPTLLIKGAALPQEVGIERAGLGDDPNAVVASDPRELHYANPGAMIGGCVRYTFKRGMKLVLFLVRDEKGILVPFRSSFSRDAEDVPDENALWVKAVREYAAISLMPREEWKDRLAERSAELLAKKDDPDAVAIGADMEIERKGKRLMSYD